MVHKATSKVRALSAWAGAGGQNEAECGGDKGAGELEHDVEVRDEDAEQDDGGDEAEGLQEVGRAVLQDGPVPRRLIQRKGPLGTGGRKREMGVCGA